MDQARKKNLIRNLLVLFVSLVVSLLLAEIVLRLVTDLPQPRIVVFDKWIGHKLRPGLSSVDATEGQGRFTMNSYGFRDREWPLKADKYRIAVLGDSFTEALQVDLDQAFHKIVERKLPMVETMNFGIRSQGTIQELLTYRHYARRFHPQMVVLAFFAGNDLTDNLQLTRPRWRMPVWADLNGDHLVFHKSKRQILMRLGWPVLDIALYRSALGQALYNLRLRRVAGEHRNAIAAAGLWDGAFSEPKTEEAKRIWRLTEAAILTLRDEVVSDGAKLLVMFVTQDVQVDAPQRANFQKKHPDLDVDFAEKHLAAFCEKNGIPSLRLSEQFLKYNEATGKALHGFGETRGGHWNAEGHRLAGELLAEKIKSLMDAAKTH